LTLSRCIFASKIVKKLIIFLKVSLAPVLKIDAKTMFFILKSSISFFITKTGMSQWRTTFSVLDPTNISSKPETP
jgi:hypothetical protein